MALYEELGRTIYEGIFGGTEVTAIPAGIELAGGQGILKRGAVLGLVDKADDPAAGKYRLVDKAATDGSQIARMVLSQDVDTGEDGAPAVGYKTGVYRRDALIFAAGDSVENHEDELRRYNIHTKAEF